MSMRQRTDVVLLMATLALLMVSVTWVYSSSASQQAVRGDEFAMLIKQLQWVGLGLVALFAAMQFDYSRLKSKPLMWALAGAMAVPLAVVLAMPQVNKSHRWILLGSHGQIQPSEFAKLVLVLFVAWRSSATSRRTNRWNRHSRRSASYSASSRC